MRMYNSTNRVLDLIEKRRGQIANGVKPDGSPITVDLVAFEKTLDLSLEEFVAFQNIKSRAQVLGKINLDEAMTIYAALGEGGNWAADTDLATKLIVTQIMEELITMQLAGRI